MTGEMKKKPLIIVKAAKPKLFKNIYTKNSLLTGNITRKISHHERMDDRTLIMFSYFQTMQPGSFAFNSQMYGLRYFSRISQGILTHGPRNYKVCTSWTTISSSCDLYWPIWKPHFLPPNLPSPSQSLML
jgi:hypothetical protein